MSARLAAAALVLGPALGAQAQVLHVGELNTEQIRRLDRAKTAVIFTGGILEQHGPYLPSHTDAYQSEWLARGLAEAIAARPGWTALMFPTLPLGYGGANQIGSKFSFPGTYNVRSDTLRAVYMDLADSLGEQGFRWVLVVDNHGAPRHNAALDDAGDYYHDVYGGRMVHLFGLQEVRTCCGEPKRRLLGEDGMKEDGFTVHAGAREHAAVMFLRPDLVSPAVADAPAVTGTSFADLVRLAGAPAWAGYFGSPRLGSAALGAQSLALTRDLLVSLASRILEGWDPSAERRYVAAMDADRAYAELDRGLQADEQRRRQRQRDWLERRKR